MSIDRRNILFAAAALATAASRSAQAYKQRERVSQQELDEAIRLHGMWLTDINTGQRCMFGGRDLSGLHFGVLAGGPVDLNGADFTQADLSGTAADDILVHHCSFNGAKLDGCCWRQPVFAFADMRRASAKRAEWGTPALRGSPHYTYTPPTPAVPEPSTWAMMLIGFGGIGFMMYRRSKAITRTVLV